MADLWITGDSWGTLDNDEPETHWVFQYKEKYNLENVYCLAKPGMAQDAINYLTYCVVKNIQWPGRTEKWNFLDDRIIVFPTTSTRLTYNREMGVDEFDVDLGPHNFVWSNNPEHISKSFTFNQHHWYDNDERFKATLVSQNYYSATMEHTKRYEEKIIRDFSVMHSCKFSDWQDTNHLSLILKEVNNKLVYGSDRLPAWGSLFDKEKGIPPKIGKEQVNHLTANRHKAYWEKIKHNV